MSDCDRMETEYFRKVKNIEADIADYQSTNTLVILYAPHVTQRRTRMLLEKFSYYLGAIKDQNPAAWWYALRYLDGILLS